LTKNNNRSNSTISSSGDTKNKQIRKKEKWSDIISTLNIDISKPVNHVTAKQIKQISNEEPRLMAKMDRLEDVPKIFKDNNFVSFTC
jgi:PAB1-binding protein PBP1